MDSGIESKVTSSTRNVTLGTVATIAEETGTPSGSEGIGVLDLSRLCQAEFPGSRVCRQDEIIETVDPAIIQAGATETAWVLPNQVDLVGGDACASPGGDNRGLIVDHRGTFLRSAFCSEARSVACCAPVP